jgi:hypothetical protein
MLPLVTITGGDIVGNQIGHSGNWSMASSQVCWELPLHFASASHGGISVCRWSEQAPSSTLYLTIANFPRHSVVKLWPAFRVLTGQTSWRESGCLFMASEASAKSFASRPTY